MKNNEGKTDYRKFSKSKYLASYDIEKPVNLTISHVNPEKSFMNKEEMLRVAYFVENNFANGDRLKPMVLNSTNCKILEKFTSSRFIEDWSNVPVTIYVANGIRMGADIVDGLRISKTQPRNQKPELTPEHKSWGNAVNSYADHGDIERIKKHVNLSSENEKKLIEQAAKGASKPNLEEIKDVS